jgi:hypothetical protein
MSVPLADDGNDHLADHVPTQDENLGFIELPGVDKFFEDNSRTMDVGREKDAGGLTSKKGHDNLRVE